MKRIIVVGMLLSAFLGSNSYAQQTVKQLAVEEFQGFWSEFRAAVLTNDKEKVASMTRFPFKTRGIDDSDPVTKHSKDSFLKLWDKLLAQDPGLAQEPDTMWHFIEQKTVVTNKDFGAGSSDTRIANFKFEKVQGKWLFTFAYLDGCKGIR